ncbi:uncharacterized protein [Rutidosis leptorrhynchoides]|uniref:uncharacterized protein n=1 Tax=Rutidosis leptorrhynchoides TaxID=125765 RepID=UPI003A993115
MGDGTTDTAITLINKLDFGDPLYLHASDTTGTPLISVKLKGTKNYQIWSRSILLALSTKNKIGFVDGTCVKNTTNDVLSSQWDRCNSVVLSWILGSLSEELYCGQIFSSIASVVWTELKETYDKVDGSNMFNLHAKINTIKQNGSSVSEYFHKLNTLWKQYDAMLNLVACTCDAATGFKKHDKLMRCMQFLMGLDDTYMHTRSNILMIDPFPDVKTAFAIISREESHRGSSSGNNNAKVQHSAFVAQTNKPNFSNNGGKNSFTRHNNQRGPNPNLQCSKCNKIGHTIDRCYKIIGFPPNFKKPNNSGFNENFKANNVMSDNTSTSSNNQSGVLPTPSTPLSLSSDQIAKLMSMLSDSPSTASNISSNMSGMIYNCNVFFNENFQKFFNFNSQINNNKGWIIDSGANQHMTVSEKCLDNIIDVSNLNLKVIHPNGTEAKIRKIGNLKLSDQITLYDVLVVPGYCVSLLSVSKIAMDSNLRISFDKAKCYIQDSVTRTVKGTGSLSGGLYMFDDAQHASVKCNFSAISCESTMLWHSRLGHPSQPVLHVLKHKLNLDNKTIEEPCEVCLRAKHSRDPFPLSDHVSVALGDLIHVDLWGPYKTASREGFKLFLTIVDDYSRAVWVYMLKSKEDVFDNLTNFVNMILTQFDKRVKIVRSDNGTEFVNNQLKHFFDTKGIIHQTSIAYTPQQNGVVERKHRHLLNVARSLMFQGGIPLFLWSDCILTATYLINRTPS